MSAAPVDRVRVGIASWLDAALVESGEFYPKKSMTAEARLRYYAQVFDNVELNSSYYAIPDARHAALWAERTPPGFIFNVKAYALLTGHHPREASLPAELRLALPVRPPRTRRGEVEWDAFSPAALAAAFRLFRAAIQPLADAGKLGYVLFQFAPWVRFSDAALAYVQSLPGRLPGWTLAVEFRDRSWFPDHAADTLDVLKQAGLAHVVVDAPLTYNAVPRVTTATAKTAVVRLHGRNAEGWLRQARGQEPTVREKYGYLYAEAELAELVPEIRALIEEAEHVVVTFNNNDRAWPVVNALMLRRMLGQPIPDGPWLALITGGGAAAR